MSILYVWFCDIFSWSLFNHRYQHIHRKWCNFTCTYMVSGISSVITLFKWHVKYELIVIWRTSFANIFLSNLIEYDKTALYFAGIIFASINMITSSLCSLIELSKFQNMCTTSSHTLKINWKLIDIPSNSKWQKMKLHELMKGHKKLFFTHAMYGIMK